MWVRTWSLLCRKDEDDNRKPESDKLWCYQVSKILEKCSFRGSTSLAKNWANLDWVLWVLVNTCLINTFFSRAELQQADFTGAELDSINFCNANLLSCSFTGAALKGAVFAGACLMDSSFCKADLQSAHLRNANLSNSNFMGGEFGAS